MTLIDPLTVQRLLYILDQTSRKWDNRADLERAVADMATLASSSSTVPNFDHQDFVVRSIDWGGLATNSTDTAFATDMKQDHGHACALNSVRFVLQKRYDVMLGRDRVGDRLVLCLIDNKYYGKHDYDTELLRYEISLTVAEEWLAALGIKAHDPVVVTDIAHYINIMRGQMAGMFLVAGDLNGADHTYVLYEFKTVAGQLEAKVYNPWRGKNLPQDVSDWYDVADFQTASALPLDTNGKKIPDIRPDGQHKTDSAGNYLYLRPQDPRLASIAPLHYSVMFVPAL